jgi:hypothetical protein
MAWDRMPDEGEQTRHLNGNPADNRLSNLEWGTQADNEADKEGHGTVLRGEDNPSATLTDKDVIEARRLRKDDPNEWSYRALARRFGVKDITIKAAITGRTWAHLNGTEAPEKISDDDIAAGGQGEVRELPPIGGDGEQMSAVWPLDPTPPAAGQGRVVEGEVCHIYMKDGIATSEPHRTTICGVGGGYLTDELRDIPDGTRVKVLIEDGDDTEEST